MTMFDINGNPFDFDDKERNEKLAKLEKPNVKVINDLCEAVTSLAGNIGLPSDLETLKSTVKQGAWDQYIQVFYERANNPEGLQYDLRSRDKILQMVDSAIVEWAKMEEFMLVKNRISKEELFESIGELMRSGRTKRLLNFKYAVQNVQWPLAFVWRLPLVYPPHMDKLLGPGRMMATMFYFEMFSANRCDWWLNNKNISDMEVVERMRDTLPGKLVALF